MRSWDGDRARLLGERWRIACVRRRDHPGLDGLGGDGEGRGDDLAARHQVACLTGGRAEARISERVRRNP